MKGSLDSNSINVNPREPCTHLNDFKNLFHLQAWMIFNRFYSLPFGLLLAIYIDMIDILHSLNVLRMVEGTGWGFKDSVYFVVSNVDNGFHIEVFISYIIMTAVSGIMRAAQSGLLHCHHLNSAI